MHNPDTSTVSAAYAAQVSAGRIASDPAQIALAHRLDVILDEIRISRLASKSSALGWLFARKGKSDSRLHRGLYVHGAVGRGKTMLMDMFFELVPARRKRRAHLNDFMADVHERIHAHRQKLARGETRESDPVPPVASQLHAEAWVLCFDEFTVTDIADAMLLKRLFEQLFQRGCVLIATSNVMPDELYRDGLNRQLFLPFIGLLKEYVDVINLDARTDYRLEKAGQGTLYRLLEPGEGDEVMDRAWAAVTAGKTVGGESVTVKGRQLKVPLAGAGAARFSFEALCEAALGASDYMALAGRYHTLFIDRVPRLDRSRRNAVKRFILLIDTLYDRKTTLFVSAEGSPTELYVGAGGTEAFEFARTASRLIEMQAAAYLAESLASREGKAGQGA